MSAKLLWDALRSNNAVHDAKDTIFENNVTEDSDEDDDERSHIEVKHRDSGT